MSEHVLTGPTLPPPSHPDLGAALRAAAASEFGVTFVDAREEETRLSWAELYTRAERVARSLVARGLLPGSRVALVLPTSAAFLDAFFGTLLAGGVPVPLYPPLRLGRLAEYQRSTSRMMAVSGARALITERRIGLILGEALALLPEPPPTWTVDELVAGAASVALPPLDGDALALIQFSSGSTVDPKPVALTHRQLLAQLSALKALMPAESLETPCGVSWLPLYHDMGLIGCLLAAAYYPGNLVLLPPEAFLARPQLWLRALSRHRGGISPAPNFAYGLLLKRLKPHDLDGVDLSSWRYALNGAEPVTPELLRRFCDVVARTGFDPSALMPVYGLSEAALAVTFSPRRKSPRVCTVDPSHLARHGEVVPGSRQIASVGTPVPGAEVAIRDEVGATLPPGKLGSVFVRGPFVMERYFGNEAATAQALQHGWLDTGDLGFIADGELYLCGRKKDLVIVRGQNHVPQEFEEVVEGLEGVRAGGLCAVGLVNDDGESLLMLVEREGELPAAELAERVAVLVLERTGIRPAAVEVLEKGALPRTSSGKVRRGEALRRYLAGELDAPGEVTALGIAKEVARGQLHLARRKLFG